MTKKAWPPKAEPARTANGSSAHQFPNRQNPIQAGAARIGGAVPPAIQRRVSINEFRAYDGDEVIKTFAYSRDGCPGGKHFVSDLIIKTVVQELVLNQKRDDAMNICETLWKGTGFKGTLTIPKFTDNVHFDGIVNDVISAISNQKSNLFDGKGSGDNGGQSLDVPNGPTELKKVGKYATKLGNGLTAVSKYLGKTGTDLQKELANYAQ